MVEMLTVQHDVNAGVVQEGLDHLAQAVRLAVVGGVGVVLCAAAHASMLSGSAGGSTARARHVNHHACPHVWAMKRQQLP